MGERVARRVLLIGWSGDWNICESLLERGLMPNLKRLRQCGASGELTAVTPLLSAPAWTTVATGMRPFKHGILGLFEADEDVGGARPASSESRATKALWNILTEAGFIAHVVGWPGAHPAEPISGINVTDRHMVAGVEFGKPWPQPDRSVHPTALCPIFAPMRMHPEEIDRDALEFFIPSVDTVMPGESRWLKMCRKWLAATITNHAVATWVMEQHPWDFMGVCYAPMERLTDSYLKFRPPGDQIPSDRQCELLQNIVPASYQFHDMMLGRLLQLAGEDAVVILVSPYGLKLNTGRARQPHGEPEDVETEHRPRGMIVVRGEQITRGELLDGASTLDVTPTVLGLLGLPIGSDMDGRPLPLPIGESNLATAKYIDSWNLSGVESGARDTVSSSYRPQTQAAIDELAALGFRDPREEELVVEQQRVLGRNKFNLARSLIEAGAVDQALSELKELLADPNPSVAVVALAIEAYLIVGAYDHARGAVERLLGSAGAESLAKLFLGRIALGRGDFPTAIGHLRTVTNSSPNDSRAWMFLGRAQAALGEIDDARSSFQRALDLEPDHPDARQALRTLSKSTN